MQNPSNGIQIKDTQLEPKELAISKIFWYYFLSFADPVKQSWLSTISEVLDQFCNKKDPEVVKAVLAAIQIMRTSRSSTFCLNASDCKCCSIFKTDNEQNFLKIIRLLSEGNIKKASAYGFVLCESNGQDMLLRSIQLLAKICYSK